jgi:hypothetical protein
MTADLAIIMHRRLAECSHSTSVQLKMLTEENRLLSARLKTTAQKVQLLHEACQQAEHTSERQFMMQIARLEQIRTNAKKALLAQETEALALHSQHIAELKADIKAKKAEVKLLMAQLEEDSVLIMKDLAIKASVKPAKKLSWESLYVIYFCLGCFLPLILG